MGREGDRRQQQREERNEKQLQMVSALHVLLWVSRPPHGEEERGVGCVGSTAMLAMLTMSFANLAQAVGLLT